MATRRQEKLSRAVKEAVSKAIRSLNDPRIEGFVSVTRVVVAADLRTAQVYLSVFGGDETSQRKTFSAIEHAKGRIQALLADELDSKFCPVLHLRVDEDFKKTLETMKLIDEAARELDSSSPNSSRQI